MDAIRVEIKDPDDNVPMLINQEEDSTQSLELTSSMTEYKVQAEKSDVSETLEKLKDYYVEIKMEAGEYKFNDVIAENRIEVHQIPDLEPPESNLQRPKSWLSSESIVVCVKCGKSLSKNCIRRHMNEVHFKVKRFSCDLCGYRTNDKTNLKRHMGKHNPEEFTQYCHVCEKQFSSKNCLKRHLKTHSEDSPGL